jgi:hypothetical protein
MVNADNSSERRCKSSQSSSSSRIFLVPNQRSATSESAFDRSRIDHVVALGRYRHEPAATTTVAFTHTRSSHLFPAPYFLSYVFKTPSLVFGLDAQHFQITQVPPIQADPDQVHDRPSSSSGSVSLEAQASISSSKMLRCKGNKLSSAKESSSLLHDADVSEVLVKLMAAQTSHPSP